MHVILKKDEFKKHENALNLKKIEKHIKKHSSLKWESSNGKAQKAA